VTQYYRLDRKLRADSTLLFQRSHGWDLLRTGKPLRADFEEPFVCFLDEDTADCPLATLYTSPAHIVSDAILGDLRELGIDNFEAKRTVIDDDERALRHEGYWLLNVLDCVHCVVMPASDHQHLGPGMDVIDEVVLDPARIPDRELFLLGEDPAVMVISERVHDHLASRGYPDLFFDPIRVLDPEA